MNKIDSIKEQLITENSRDLSLMPDKYIEILLSALEIGSSDILLLEKGIENGDYQSIHVLAHKLKGMFGNLRLRDICCCAEKIDDLAKSKGQIKHIKQTYIEFKKVFNEINELFL